MSWLVCVLAIPAEFSFYDQVSGNEDSMPSLGSYSEVIRAIREVWPSVEQDPFDNSLYRIDTDDTLATFVLSEPTDAGLCFRSDGSSAFLENLKQLCDQTGWRAWDSSTGEFLDFDAYL